MGEVKTYTPASVRRPMDVDHDVIGRAQEPTSLTNKRASSGCSQRLAGDPCSQIAGQCHERSINHAAKYGSSFRFLSTTRGGVASGEQRQRPPFSTTAGTAHPVLASPPSHCGTCLPYLVGTEILYSSKGVANTAILNSSSAAFGLIPPSRFLSILNHLSIPTRTASGLPRIDAFFIRLSSLRYGSQLAGTSLVVGYLFL